jgi:hypothetical protein
MLAPVTTVIDLALRPISPRSSQSGCYKTLSRCLTLKGTPLHFILPWTNPQQTADRPAFRVHELCKPALILKTAVVVALLFR